MASFSNPKLVVLAAPSGAGKTTLCQMLLEDFHELILSVSTTTRAPRKNAEGHVEVDGEHYFFVTKEIFQSKASQNEFAEWAEVHGNFYGTSKEFILNSFAKFKSVLLDIDVQGAESLRRLYGDKVLSVFIAPPSIEILEKRLRARKTESEPVLLKRLENAKNELLEAPKFDAVIVNHDLNDAYNALKRIVFDWIKYSKKPNHQEVL